MTKYLLILLFIFLFSLPLFAQEVDTAWVRRYNGPVDWAEDVALAIVVDNSGNVYVTGYSSQNNTVPFNYDYTTIKYLPNGDTGWVRRYTGPVDSSDAARSIALDGSGNVYVTGLSWGGGTSADYATIKYYPNGDTLWVRRYNGPVNSVDRAWAVAVDGSWNAYVTGGSEGSGTGLDYATIKYSLCVEVVVGDLALPLNGLRTPADLVVMINYLFRKQPPPHGVHPCAGDLNQDDRTSPSDLVTLINHLFKSQALPCESCGC